MLTLKRKVDVFSFSINALFFEMYSEFIDIRLIDAKRLINQYKGQCTFTERSPFGVDIMMHSS